MIVLSLGVPEMGKTQALMDYVNAHAQTHRFFVVCRAGDWQAQSIDDHGKDRWRGLQWRQWSNGVRRILEKAKQWGEMQLVNNEWERRGINWYGEAPSPSEDVEGWLTTLPRAGLFRFGHPWEGSDVARLVKRIGNTTYVDDEIDLTAIHAGWLPSGAYEGNPLRDFCHRGRHMPNAYGEVTKIHILGAARQVQSLHPDMTNLASGIFVFRLQGWRTIKRVLDEGIITQEEVETIKTLQPYHYKHWNPSRDSSWGQLAPL